MFYEDLVLVLIKLADAHNVSREPWDVVDPAQLPVLAALELEEDGTAPLDRHDGAVPETHGAAHAGVQLGEDGALGRHVVRGSCIKDPASAPPFGLLAELHEQLVLADVDRFPGAKTRATLAR